MLSKDYLGQIPKKQLEESEWQIKELNDKTDDGPRFHRDGPNPQVE